MRRWKSKEEKHIDGSKILTYDLKVDDYSSNISRITIKINISSANIFDTFSLITFNEGIKSFKQKYPQIIPEGIGYIDEETKLYFILGILDNGAGPKSVYISDNHSAKFLPSNVKHSMLERKQVILDILTVLAKDYEFPSQTHQVLKQRFETSFTFLGAVTTAKNRIENAKIFRSVAYYPDEEKLEELKAQKFGVDAVNVRSAMEKLLLFAAGKKFENFTPEEIEILLTKDNEKRIITILGKDSSWLICLHKEFPREMAAAANNEALPSESTTQSYAKIQSAISSKEEEEEVKEKEEEIKFTPATEDKREQTMVSAATETSRLIKRERRAKPKPEPEEEACITCTIL